jgi:uncharacterized protein
MSNLSPFHPVVLALIGGVLIGAAAWLLWASIGRVAGVSGVAASALVSPRQEPWRWAFLLPLVVVGGAALWWLPLPTPVQRGNGLLIAAGALVGVGTVLANGCTSGHGVCGLGRLSRRSMVAVAVFMGSGMLTASAIYLIAK